MDDDVADAGGGAVGGIEGVSSSSEFFELFAEGLELVDAFVELDGVLGDESEDMRAGCLPAYAELDDLSDLSECETDGLGCPGEGEAVEDVGVVGAIAVGFSAGGVEDADAFVVADCFDRDAGVVGDLSDAHQPGA